jgi:hypothetical protein
MYFAVRFLISFVLSLGCFGAAMYATEKMIQSLPKDIHISYGAYFVLVLIPMWILIDVVVCIGIAVYPALSRANQFLFTVAMTLSQIGLFAVMAYRDTNGFAERTFLLAYAPFGVCSLIPFLHHTLYLCWMKRSPKVV